jgi:hypothetical protein
LTGWYQATEQFLKYASFLQNVPSQPQARMEAFLKSKYGDDFIAMEGFHDTTGDDEMPLFHYAARAIIWKLPDYEVT